MDTCCVHPSATSYLKDYELESMASGQVASDPLNTWGTYAVGHSLWTAAPELISVLAEALPAGVLHGQRVIELGAGLGAVGNVSCCCRRSVQWRYSVCGRECRHNPLLASHSLTAMSAVHLHFCDQQNRFAASRFRLDMRTAMEPLVTCMSDHVGMALCRRWRCEVHWSR